MRPPATAPATALALVLAAALGGCSNLSGAGTMRVEVEVYKGPVGQSAEIQAGELAAILAESARAIDDWRREAVELYHPTGAKSAAIDCKSARTGGPDADCRALQKAIEGAQEIVAAICDMGPFWIDKSNWPLGRGDAPEPMNSPNLGDLCDDSRVASSDGLASRPAVGPLGKPDQPRVLDATRFGTPPGAAAIEGAHQEYSRRFATVGALMRDQAVRATQANVASIPRAPLVRAATANFAFIAGEYGKRISARIGVAQKLFEGKGKGWDRQRNLPMGDYLRESTPTAFLSAFDYFDAFGDFPPGALNRRDRERAFHALNNDLYWGKINEVYASGIGDVAMAFVKDDLGNWNLKSFSADPTNLLAAYRDGASALLKAGVKLATKGSGLSDGQKMIGLAGQLATGRADEAESLGGLDIAQLRARARQRLNDARAQLKARQDTLAKSIGAEAAPGPRWQAAIDAKNKADTQETELTGAINQQSTAKTTYATCVAGGGTCQDELTGLNIAIESVVTARGALATLRAVQATADAELAQARAEQKQLPERAAELVDRVLSDYAGDIAILQEASLPSPPATPTTPASTGMTVEDKE